MADKISGNLVGIWLLIPEYLRLGVWDLLKTWTASTDEHIAPRLALQLVNEAALCVTGIRQNRSLSQKGFELANGLPFVCADTAIHALLDSHSVAEAQRLQIALGKIRDTFGHYPARVLAIDPHRIESYTKRQMVRSRKTSGAKSRKMAQTFFCLDAHSYQPVCFVAGSAARTTTTATKELLEMSAQILKLNGQTPLVVADTEHYTAELFQWVDNQSPFDLLTPVSSSKSLREAFETIDPEQYQTHWPGFATTKRPFKFTTSSAGPFHQVIQRKGERKADYDFKAFLCTSDREQIRDLSENYPDRWHIEEFFKNDQALGWNRAGTMNLNIQYGRMTMSLLAQAAIHMLRQRVGKPVSDWDSKHMATEFLRGLEGDVRVKDDTIRVTYYNAPNSDLLKKHYQGLPEKIEAQKGTATVPWLYDFKLDFRFK